MTDQRSAWDEIRGQTCHACGHRDKFDFHVPNELWVTVVPDRHVGHVVCLGCFDNFARERGVDYSGAIQTLYFAGDKSNFKFKRLWGVPT